MQKAAQRKNAIKDGFFDGRFAAKVVPNKKKKLLNKNNKINIYEI